MGEFTLAHLTQPSSFTCSSNLRLVSQASIYIPSFVANIILKHEDLSAVSQLALDPRAGARAVITLGVRSVVSCGNHQSFSSQKD